MDAQDTLVMPHGGTCVSVRVWILYFFEIVRRELNGPCSWLVGVHRVLSCRADLMSCLTS